MSDDRPLDIKVIYTADDVRARKPARRRAAEAAPTPTPAPRTSDAAPASRSRSGTTPATTTSSTSSVVASASRSATVLTAPRRGRARFGSRTGSRAAGTIAPSTAIGVSLAHVLVGAVLFYVTWWQVDPYFSPIMAMKTPLPLSPDEVDAASQIFLPQSDAAARPRGRVRHTPPSAPRDSAPENAGSQDTRAGESAGSRGEDSGLPNPRRFSAEVARIMIPATMYGWLTLSSVSVGLLALAAGATLPLPRGGARTGVALLGAALLAFLLWRGYAVWREAGVGFSVPAVRWGIAGAGAAALLIGATFGCGGRSATRVAAGVLILAAAGSVLALYFGRRCDALEPGYTDPVFLTIVFAVHSFYAWLLLPLSSRLGV
jgi:hypothetical protein